MVQGLRQTEESFEATICGGLAFGLSVRTMADQPQREYKITLMPIGN